MFCGELIFIGDGIPKMKSVFHFILHWSLIGGVTLHKYHFLLQLIETL
jgi:hypothetical protein